MPAPSDALPWLIRLRWWAVGLQLVAVGLAAQATSLSWPPLVAVIGGVGLSNLVLTRLGDGIIRWVLIFDTLALTLLLHFSGGAANPFTVLYVVHVALAAVLIGPRWTWIMAALSVGCFGVLFLSSPGDEGLVHDAAAMQAHLIGMWVGYALVGVTIAWFVSRLAATLRVREVELERARAQAERSARLASLSTLAGGAAHEMGSPLATVAVVVGELQRSCAAGEVPADLGDDLTLIQAEIARCREILAELSADFGAPVGEGVAPVGLTELATSLQQLDPALIIAAPELAARLPRRAMTRALSNLLRNARRAAGPAGRVELRITAGEQLRFCVSDDGPGVAPEVLTRIGEPFFTTQRAGEGMGLGVFLARRVAEELGGALHITSTVGQGTTVTMELPKL